MKTAAAALAAVLMIAGCGGSENTPAVTRYSITAEGVTCDAPSLEDEFDVTAYDHDGRNARPGGAQHICVWCGPDDTADVVEFLRPVGGEWRLFLTYSAPVPSCPLHG